MTQDENGGLFHYHKSALKHCSFDTAHCGNCFWPVVLDYLHNNLNRDKLHCTIHNAIVEEQYVCDMFKLHQPSILG